MDSTTVAEQLHRQPESQDTVPVAITDVKHRVAACGFTHYLLKLAEPDHLRNFLAALLAIRLKDRRPSNKGTKKLRKPKGLCPG